MAPFHYVIQIWVGMIKGDTMERNTEENEFLRQTKEFSDVKEKMQTRNMKLFLLWLVLGVVSISFLLSKFF